MYKILLPMACLVFSVTGKKCPNIITKAEWGSIGGLSAPLAIYPPRHVVIHHSENVTCNTQSECSALVRDLQNHHINDNGWEDIGNNFLIGGDGNVYQGRGWGKTGSHAPGDMSICSKSLGICMIGTFSTSLPTDAAMRALKQLIDCGVGMGEIDKNYRLIGHRQTTTSTDCPGDELYSVIQKWDHWVKVP